MWFFEVASPKITIRIFKFVWEIGKCSHLREKRGGADAFENDPPFMSKGTVLCVYIQPCVCTAVDLTLDLLNLELSRVYSCIYSLGTRSL
jgi:hypothetical protein